MRFKPPKFLRRTMPDLVWNIPEQRDVFLTFDDGPTPGVTEWILDRLRAHGARATFFCLGANVEKYPDLYARIVAEGHSVGNHTHSHRKGWGTRPKSYAADVLKASELIGGNLFRPPYGRITRRQSRILAPRYRIVMWNIISRDYSARVTPERCLANVVERLRAGDIVVFHDSVKARANMSYALPRLLEHMRERGMTSKSIEL
jgi:peptidoglycan/xylan/chitin deacetylase (PgdA/CDA1 family)